MEYGVLIAFEGIDKSGKETQVGELAKKFTLEGENVVVIDFPSYDTPSGQAIRAILDGTHYLSPSDAMEYQSLMAINMYEQQTRIEHALMMGRVVICDRYLHSRMAFGLVRGLDKEWLEDTAHSLVQPDVVILLDITEQEYLRRCDNYDTLDIHERDTTFIREVSKVYRQLAEESDNWLVINGEGNPDDISKRVYEVVATFLAEMEE